MIKIFYVSDALGNLWKPETTDWALPTVLKTFEKLSESHIVVASKGLYESHAKESKPLPGAVKYVISETKIEDPDVITVSCLKELLDLTIAEDYIHKNKDIWVIGGDFIYKQIIHATEQVYHARIYGEFESSHYFNIREYQSYFSLSDTSYSLNPQNNRLAYNLNIYKRK